jgi:hypothetical protein
VDKFIDSWTVETTVQDLLSTYLISGSPSDYIQVINDLDSTPTVPYVAPEVISCMVGDIPRPQSYPAIRLGVQKSKDDVLGPLTAGTKVHTLSVVLYVNTQVLGTPATVREALRREAYKLCRAVELALDQNLSGSGQIFNFIRTGTYESQPWPGVLKLELLFTVWQRVFQPYGTSTLPGSSDVDQISSEFSLAAAAVDVLRTRLNASSPDEDIIALINASGGVQVDYVLPEVIEWSADEKPAPQGYPAIRVSVQDTGVQGTGGSSQFHNVLLSVCTFARVQAFISRSGVLTPSIYDACHKHASKLARAAEYALLKYLPLQEDVVFELADLKVTVPFPGVVAVEKVFWCARLSERVIDPGGGLIE